MKAQFTAGQTVLVNDGVRPEFPAYFDSVLSADAPLPTEFQPPLPNDARIKVWTYQGDLHYLTPRQVRPA